MSFFFKSFFKGRRIFDVLSSGSNSTVRRHLRSRVPQAFLVASWVRFLGLEEEMATRSSILVWSMRWTEEPGGLRSTGSQRVGHHRAAQPACPRIRGFFGREISLSAQLSFSPQQD